MGTYLIDRLRELTAEDERVATVRGSGLFVGVDLVTDRSTNTPDGDLAGTVVNSMRRRRVLISASGPHGNVLKIRPPLPFGHDHADRLLEAFAATLAGSRQGLS